MTLEQPQQILIVEDSPTQLARLSHLLEQYGFEVTAAHNGREALQLLESLTPVLVITDVVMPELDGYGLCRAIKADERWRQIPIMLVTTLADAEDVIRGLEVGADNFIRKPYGEKYLLSRIEYLLMNHELRRNQKMQMGVEISLGGRKHFITSERQQILDLLISTYEQAIHINADLAARETELEEANAVLAGLCRVAEGLNRAETESEVAKIALERAVDLPGVRAGWIFLRDGEDRFRLAAACNLPAGSEACRALDRECECKRLGLAGELDGLVHSSHCTWLQPEDGKAVMAGGHASIPLRLAGRTLGIMNLVGPLEGLFPERDVEHLNGIGQQVAIALDRAHLLSHLETLVGERTRSLEAEIVERERIEQELRRQARREAAVAELGRHALANISLPAFFGEASRLLTDTLNVPIAGLLEVLPNGAEVVVHEAIGWSAEVVGSIFPAGDRSQTRLTLESGAPVIVADYSTETRFDPSPLLLEQKIVSGLSAMIPGKQRPFGVMGAVTQTSRTFSEGDAHFIEAIANLVGTAIEQRSANERIAEQAALIDEANDAIVVRDIENHIVFWNKGAERVYGWPRGDALGRRFDQLLKIDHAVFEEAERMVRETGMWSGEIEKTTADGTVLTVDCRWTLLRDAQGHPKSILTLDTDITDRKRAERELLKSEERYRLLFAHNPHPMYLYDLETLAFLAVNDAAMNHYGYSRDEFLTMTTLDIRPPEEIPPTLAALAIPRTPLQHSGEWVHKLRDGRRIDVEITSHTMTYEGREAALVVAQDITERKRAREAVHAAQERLRRAVSAGNIGLWEWDLKTNEVEYSPEWKHQIGHDENEITSAYSEWESRLHPGDRERMINTVRSYIESSCPDFFEEYRLRHKDGSYRHVIAQASLDLDGAGTPIRMVGSHVDITERVQMEEQFLQSQKMEGIGRLAGGVAHDFNNLLTVIMTYSEFVGRSLGRDHPEYSSLQEIINAAKRAGALTRQLLNFSRKHAVERVPINLSDVLRGLEPMLSRVIGEDIVLSIVPGDGLGLVRADAGQIEQVLMNLVVNARDAMPDGGEIRIETSDLASDDARRKHLSFLAAGSYALLELEDTGAGMDESVRKMIFDPFFTTKEVGKGTGLGLSTVYSIIKQSGGEVVVASELGKGTTFQVFLPRIEDEEQGERK